MSTTTQTAHCPDCHSTAVALYKHVSDSFTLYYFHCFNCRMETPMRATLAEAADFMTWEALPLVKRTTQYSDEY